MKCVLALFLCISFTITSSTITSAQSVDSLRLMADLKYLSSDELKGRAPGTYGGRLAQYYLVSQFQKIGLKSYDADYRQHIRVLGKKIDKKGPDSLSNFEQVRGANVIGYIPGKKKEVIVVSAHFDHVGVVDGVIYNGADDNASGVAAMLAIAGHFAKNPPQHTLLFAAFDAEEMYIRGSLAFISKLPVPIEDIKLNFNMDLIGTQSKGGMFIGGTLFDPQFKPILWDIWNQNGKVEFGGFGYDLPKDKDDRTYRSDHYVFHLSKIPFVYFGVPEHPNYHQPTDDFENISHSFYYQAVQLILKSIIEIDRNFPVKE